MARDRTIFDEPHHHSLELLAVRALRRGDAATAFQLADRRCRISPPPEPHSYVLRGEACHQLGERAAAISDLAAALQLEPGDIGASRRMLAWGDRWHEKRAAARLIRYDRDFAVLRKAIEVLRRDGKREFANVTVLDEAIEGWAAWEEEGPLEVTITDGADRVTTKLAPDPAHVLNDIGHALTFRLPRPISSSPQRIEISIAGRVIWATRSAGRDSAPDAKTHQPAVEVAPATDVTVVIPVYGDCAATRSCLESLLDELRQASRYSAVVVNDASPDPRIASYLAWLGTQPRVQVITNERNLGFAGAVNRALRDIADGDVILLNADTIVPRGFIDRLAAAARSSPDIGTVMPLSNNGDLASFPVPHTESPLGSRDEIEHIDRIAAEVNTGRLIDIPNGVGFCLYVTRACLDRLGFLSEDFDRGYFEDVDFCLKAREHGFRNVCAPSVYVGHAGSKSFRDEKRSLVARNRGVLRYRYPRYCLEFAAFDEADPLRSSRAAIEGQDYPATKRPTLLITGAGAVGAIARDRGRRLAGRGQPVLIFEVHHRPGGPRVTIMDSAGGVPQSLAFNLSSAAECDALKSYCRMVRPSRIEILDPANVPFCLVDLLRELKIPYAVVIADAGLLGRAGAALLAATRSVGAGDVTGISPEDEVWLRGWRDIIQGASEILAPDEQARAFAGALFERRTIRLIDEVAQPPRRVRRVSNGPDGSHLGLLPVRPCAQEQFLISGLARAFKHARPDLALTVIGATLDDLGLMRIGNTHVTGPVEDTELGRVVALHRLDFLFASATRPLFGHPLLAAAFNSSRPLAYFDWSLGRLKAWEGDLPLDLDLSLEAIVGELDRWMPQPPPRRGP
jgi:GT2 family glycosyltransferase